MQVANDVSYRLPQPGLESLASDSNHARASDKTLRRYRVGYSISSVGLGPAIAAVGTYVSIRLQTIAVTIGHEPGRPTGTGCPSSATACIIKFGPNEINLTSYLLYLGALASGVSGILTLTISGIGDRMNHQRGQYVLLLISYGVFCLPYPALRDLSQRALNTYAGLYVMANVLAVLATCWSNIFVTFAMQQFSTSTPCSNRDREVENTELDSSFAEEPHIQARSEKLGVSMSAWGVNGFYAGQIVLYCIAIGVTYVDSEYAGLWTTSATGGLCIIFALVAWPLLPRPVRDENAAPRTVGQWLRLPFAALTSLFRGLWKHTDALKFLIAFTIYGDAVSTFEAITGQLFYLTFQPTVREYTAYALAGPVISMVSATLLLNVFGPARRTCHFSLRHWSIASFIVATFCTVWCCVGISAKAKIGLKHRWEFYWMRLLTFGANSIAVVTYRVLFSQLLPRGSELRYFGFQLAISLATAWIPQVVSAPIVNATNEIRLPVTICAGILVIAIVLVLWTDEERGRDKVRSENRSIQSVPA